MKKYTLDEIKTVMKEEGIGNSSTRYIIDRLANMQKDEAAEVVAVGINQARGLIKEKPKHNTPTGSFRLMPSSNNNVHFKHNGEDCQLHFLTNGQIALSKDSNKDKFIELAANEFFGNALNKF